MKGRPFPKGQGHAQTGVLLAGYFLFIERFRCEARSGAGPKGTAVIPSFLLRCRFHDVHHTFHIFVFGGQFIVDELGAFEEADDAFG